MSTGNIARHRNYSELMRQHNRESRMKRVIRVFMYFLVVLFLLILLLIVLRWESKQSDKKQLSKNLSNNPVTLLQVRD